MIILSYNFSGGKKKTGNTDSNLFVLRQLQQVYGFSYFFKPKKGFTHVQYLKIAPRQLNTGSNQNFKVRENKYHLSESLLPLLEALTLSFRNLPFKDVPIFILENHK